MGSLRFGITPVFQALNTTNQIKFRNQHGTPNIGRNGRPAIHQQILLAKRHKDKLNVIN